MGRFCHRHESQYLIASQIGKTFEIGSGVSLLHPAWDPNSSVPYLESHRLNFKKNP